MNNYFTERAKTHKEVLEKINRKYGIRAKVLMYKNVPCRGLKGLLGKELVECTGYIVSGIEADLIQRNKDVQNRDAILKSAGVTAVKNTTHENSENRENQETSINDVLMEIREVKEQISAGTPAQNSEEHEVIQEMKDILKTNEFTESYITKLINEMKSRLSLADIENRELVHKTVVELLVSNIKIYTGGEQDRIFVLIGPTGVGKTTTIAKLAAVNALGEKRLDVRIINIDSFRIGAQSQVETYGTIMGVTVVSVDQYDELRKQIALGIDADMILVDTIGKSPSDTSKLSHMKKLLSGCGENAVFHLSLSATTKVTDMKKIIEQFRLFDYKSIIITKLDETLTVGGIISLLAEQDVAVSYFTDGQTVPLDIAVASPMRLLSRIDGLDFDISSMKDDSTDITASWR